MNRSPSNRPPTITVAQVNRYLKHLMEDDAVLSHLWVEGELSNVKPHSSGHLYFSLKDEYAAINGVMFKSYAQNVPFKPENGMKVVARGYVSLYEKSGQYQLYAEHFEPAGIGGLQTAYNQLCDKLRAEGLFESVRKRRIPAYVRCVAIVTSPTGAALQDMIRVIRQRNTAVQIVVAPAQVQGEGAAADIARAIREVNEWSGADVMIIGRGGGSAEDLWAFNEEITARAVAASRIPVISAVGHETDTVITDFVADERAPTPTAAASLAVYNGHEARAYVLALTDALHKNMRESVENKKNRWLSLTRRRCLQKPLEPVYQRQIYAQNLFVKLHHRMQKLMTNKTEMLNTRKTLLEKVSPYALWERGFTVVRDENGAAVTSAGGLTIGTSVSLLFKDGEANASVTQVTRV